MARRLLVIDADISPEIAAHLLARGRNAVSVHFVPLGGVDKPGRLEDRDLLPRLASHFEGEDWMLVTGDDQMPLQHHEVCVLLGLTIATIDGRRELWKPSFETINKWRYDVIQRFAHKMEEQTRGTFRRYGYTNRLWTPRGRVIRGRSGHGQAPQTKAQSRELTDEREGGQASFF